MDFSGKSEHKYDRSTGFLLKTGEGSVDDPGDPIQLTAECEDFRLHKTALAWPWYPASNAWQVARNWTQQHQDLTCLNVTVFVCFDLVEIITDQ